MESITIIAMLVFWIIIAAIIGGVVLLRPVSKRLGNFLDEWIAIRRAEQADSLDRVQEQAARLAALEEELLRLRESQESLKGSHEPSAIGSGD